MKKYSYHIQGMHCNACKILVEDVVEEIIQGSKTQVVMKEKIVTIEMPEEVDAWKIFPLIAEKLSSHGYTLSLEKNTSEKDGILWQAIPIGLIFLGVFFMLQKSGILNFGIGGQITPVTSFLIGLIASVSSCLAVVGGLVLSLSAKISQDSISDRKNIILFHTARILSFWLLGWLLGALWHVSR
jgi:copper chaperone CopZ